MHKLYYPQSTLLFILLLVSTFATAQDITLSAFPSPTYATSPLVAGSTGQRIFGFRLTKGAGGTNTVTQVVVGVTVADATVPRQ